MLDSKIFEELFYFFHTKALILLIFFIVFGRSFIINLKKKEDSWKIKAWVNGIISLTSLLFISKLLTSNFEFFTLCKIDDQIEITLLFILKFFETDPKVTKLLPRVGKG